MEEATLLAVDALTYHCRAHTTCPLLREDQSDGKISSWAYVLHRLIRVLGNMHPPLRYWRRRPQTIIQGLGHRLLAQ